MEDGRRRAQLEKALQRFLANCKDHTLGRIKHRSFGVEEPNRELYIPGHGEAIEFETMGNDEFCDASTSFKVGDMRNEASL